MRTTINLLFTIFILGIIFSCTNTENKQVANPDSIIKQLPELAIKPDTFHIQPQQTRAVKVNNKTFIIQENSFLYEDGSVVTEPIILKIESFDKVGDMILNGLQTVSSKGILETAGMFELEAKTKSGKKVQINPKQPLQLLTSAPKQPKSSPFELYEGKKNDLDEISWENPKPTIQFGPVPFEVLFYWRITTLGEYAKKGNAPYTQIQHMINTVDLIKYQNTWVASPEFVERSHHFNCAGFACSHTDSTLNFFLPLAHLPIHKVDSIAIQYLEKNLTKYKSPQFYRDNYGINTPSVALNTIQPIQVDSNILQDIQKNGYNPDWSNKTVKEREAIQKIRDKWLPIIIPRYECKRPLLYAIKRFGFHNIDRLLETDNLKQSVTINTQKTSGSIAFSLILKKEKVFLFKESKSPQITFEAKLPQVPAYLIAISEQEGKLLLAKKEILIGQNKEEQLELKPVTVEELEQALANIEAGYTNKN